MSKKKEKFNTLDGKESFEYPGAKPYKKAEERFQRSQKGKKKKKRS